MRGGPIADTIALISAVVFAYQAFDSFSSAIQGTQPDASAPYDDPKAISNRVGSMVWGCMSAAISLLCLWFIIDTF
jgi:hypothetical protein